MGEDEGKTGGEEKKGTDEFDPKALAPEVQESLRRHIQSESNKQTAVVERALRDEQATRARSAVETAEQRELQQLADTGQNEVLGQRVAARLTVQSAEAKAIASASDVIERQMSEAFTETLGAERVEQIRREVIQQGGAHAEFAKGLAKAEGGDSRAEEIKSEVKAALIEAGVVKRDEETGADKVSGGGQGAKPSTFEEIEAAYAAGTLLGGREAYAEAVEANKKGR